MAGALKTKGILPAAAMRRNTRTFLVNSGRAAGGALVFALPMLMTAEMWDLGLAMDRLRLAAFVLLSVPILTALSHFIGFERTSGWRDAALDAAYALAVGALIGAALLAALAVFRPPPTLDQAVGQVAVQSVPAAIGALLARSQFGSEPARPPAEAGPPYVGEMVLMGVGALFLGLNIAPTDEVMALAARMTPWHAIAVVGLSLAAMHGFVYVVGFRGGSVHSADLPWQAAFLRFTLPGYVVAAAVSLLTLWVFGGLDGGFDQGVSAMVALGLPCAIGAAAARLIV